MNEGAYIGENKCYIITAIAYNIHMFEAVFLAVNLSDSGLFIVESVNDVINHKNFIT